jgi:hypothetical protein
MPIRIQREPIELAKGAFLVIKILYNQIPIFALFDRTLASTGRSHVSLDEVNIR